MSRAVASEGKSLVRSHASDPFLLPLSQSFLGANHKVKRREVSRRLPDSGAAAARPDRKPSRALRPLDEEERRKGAGGTAAAAAAAEGTLG